MLGFRFPFMRNLNLCFSTPLWEAIQKKQTAPVEKNSRFWGSWDCRLPSRCGCCSAPEDQQQLMMTNSRMVLCVMLGCTLKTWGQIVKSWENNVEIPEFHQRHRGGRVCWGPEGRLPEWESSCSSRVWNKQTLWLPARVPAGRDDRWWKWSSNPQQTKKWDHTQSYPASIWVQEEVIKGELRLAEFRLNIVTSSIGYT